MQRNSNNKLPQPENPNKITDEKFTLIDDERKTLEEEIENLLTKCFGKNSSITSSWIFRCNRIISDSWSPNQQGFFNHFKTELTLQNDSADYQQLLKKIQSYKTIIDQEAYIQSYVERETHTHQESQRERFELQRMKEIKEEKFKAKNPFNFFKDEKYSIYKHAASGDREEKSPRFSKK